MPGRTDQDWERMWAPYDRATYQSVLEYIHPDDIVLDIGAGDLRLSRQMAQVAQHVYAIEMQLQLIDRKHPLPENLQVIIGDARQLPFPPGVTVGVLLMRHCSYFRLYSEKLKETGCGRLITNARWRMGVEQVDLFGKRIAYRDVPIGWYACWCGQVGFKPGAVDLLRPEDIEKTWEVVGCPHCDGCLIVHHLQD